MQLFFRLGFLVPLQLEKAQFQSARIVFISWRPLQPYPLSRLCFQVLLWTRRMSLSEARLYILSPPCCVLVHTTHQMLWCVICVMFWWEAGVLFTPLYICDLWVVGWGGFWVLSRSQKEWFQRKAGYCVSLSSKDSRGKTRVWWERKLKD